MTESLNTPEQVTPGQATPELGAPEGEALADEAIAVEQAAVAVNGVSAAAARRQVPPITKEDRERAAALREELGLTDGIKFRGFERPITHSMSGGTYGRTS